MDRATGTTRGWGWNLLLPGVTYIANAVTDTQVLSESAIEANCAHRSQTQ